MIDYTERIPNNVDLASDKTLQRALEKWQPAFLNWWTDADRRTAPRSNLSTNRDQRGEGWLGEISVTYGCRSTAGVFLVPAGRKTAACLRRSPRRPSVARRCRENNRSMLRRIIVTQGDTEPASVEQQRGTRRDCTFHV